MIIFPPLVRVYGPFVDLRSALEAVGSGDGEHPTAVATDEPLVEGGTEAFTVTTEPLPERSLTEQTVTEPSRHSATTTASSSPPPAEEGFSMHAKESEYNSDAFLRSYQNRRVLWMIDAFDITESAA